MLDFWMRRGRVCGLEETEMTDRAAIRYLKMLHLELAEGPLTHKRTRQVAALGWAVFILLERLPESEKQEAMLGIDRMCRAGAES